MINLGRTRRHANKVGNAVERAASALKKRASKRTAEEWDALTAERDAMRVRLERYEKHLREHRFVDATPDDGYIRRILEAHLDDSTIVATPPSPIADAMNAAQAKRNALIRNTLAALPAAAPGGEDACIEAYDPDAPAMAQAVYLAAVERSDVAACSKTFAEFIRRKIGIISANVDAIAEHETRPGDLKLGLTSALADIRAEIAKLAALASALDGGAAGKGEK